MKKTWVIVALLALTLLAARPNADKLIRLTVINKSGMELELELTGSCDENWYYLHVPEGDRTFPSETIFTIAPDIYTMSAHYIELWDPVYGYSCSDTSSRDVDARRNIRVAISECNWTPPNPGEPSMIKLGATRKRRSR